MATAEAPTWKKRNCEISLHKYPERRSLKFARTHAGAYTFTFVVATATTSLMLNFAMPSYCLQQEDTQTALEGAMNMDK